MGELENEYRREAFDSLKALENSIKILRKNKNDKQAIFEAYRSAHTLKSSSFQMGFYVIGYLSFMVNDLLKNVVSGEIKLNRERLVFLEDFYLTLKKSLDFIISNKQEGLNIKFYKKLEEMIKLDEKQKIAKKEIQLTEEKKQCKAMHKFYIKNTKKNIFKLEKNLKKVKKNNYDFISLKEVYEQAHKIKGDSLQASQFFIAYLAETIHDYVGKVIDGKKKLTKVDLMEIYDFLHTLKKYFKSIQTGKNIFDKRMVASIEEGVKERSAELEKKLAIAIQKAKGEK